MSHRAIRKSRRVLPAVVAEILDRRLMLTGTPPAVLTGGKLVVTGTAFIDNNANGVYDKGDTPLAGATVELATLIDIPNATAITNAQGTYIFTGLSSKLQGDGTFQTSVSVTPPPGYAAESPVEPLPIAGALTGINPAVYKLTSELTGSLVATSGSYGNGGDTAVNAVDGNVSTFFDGPAANGDHVGLNLGSPKVVTSLAYAPRPGFASRMVGGIFQGSNSSSFSTATTLYKVIAAPAVGVLTNVSIANTTPFQYVRYLAPNGSYGDVAEVQFFGPTVPPFAADKLTVHLFDDSNADGRQDAGEPNLVGWGKYLDLNNDGKFDGSDVRMIADASGNMTFSGLTPGVYALQQNVPAGWTAPYGFPENEVVVAGTNTAVAISEYKIFSQLSGTPIGTPGSYHNLGSTIANAFDFNSSTIFDGPDPSGDWVGLDLGTAQVVTQVQFDPRRDIPSRMKGGLIQASNSSSFSTGVVTLATISSTPATDVWTTVSLTSTTPYRFYRYIGPANSYCDIADLEFDGV